MITYFCKMNIKKVLEIEKWYEQNYVAELYGLRIVYDDIKSLIDKLPLPYKVSILGYSEQKTPIHKIKIGSGPKRILFWSQMHGNESTGTKALFDFFTFLIGKKYFKDIASKILTNCTLMFLPMLNPDGAQNYNRENANGIDLNRDAVDLEAIESRLLRNLLDKFKPHFCFNLHDQRTIFNVEGTTNPATLSFLAPSVDKQRTITKSRTETMSVIIAMNNVLQNLIPNQIGRYTDEFYPTATGDNFQKLGYNTILIEAGHYENDYNREIVRKYNFIALVAGLEYIVENHKHDDYQSYFKIPNNDSKFFDVIFRNAKIYKEGNFYITDLGVVYKYKMVNEKLLQYESVEKSGDLDGFFGYKEIDLKNKQYKP